MSNDLVKRLHRVSGWLFDTGQIGYELDTVKEAAERIEELEGALILISGYNEHQHPTKKDIDKVINFIIDRESK